MGATHLSPGDPRPLRLSWQGTPPPPPPMQERVLRGQGLIATWGLSKNMTPEYDRCWSDGKLQKGSQQGQVGSKCNVGDGTQLGWVPGEGTLMGG